jgi:hypothetical protein
MFPNSHRNNQTDREKYLEDQLEDELRRSQEEDERRRKADETRRHERLEYMREQERYAESWPEAFSKQARLCWREHNQFPEQMESDDYFKVAAEANEKALEIWTQVEAGKKAEFEAMEKQIKDLWDLVRTETADQLEAASDRKEYADTAEQIRKGDLNSYLDW